MKYEIPEEAEDIENTDFSDIHVPIFSDYGQFIVNGFYSASDSELAKQLKAARNEYGILGKS